MENVVIKEIPGTLGFKVSEDGIVYDPDDIVRNQYVNGDGYRTASVKMLDGRYQTFGVHRLIALAHVPCDGDVSQLTVNHIDHDLTHNHADNLEWVSVYLNNLHASLMRTQVDKPTIIMTDNEGRKSFIDNLHVASAVLNIDIDLAWAMVRDGREVDGFRLEAFGRRTLVPEELRKPNFPSRDTYGRSIQVLVFVKNLHTGNVDRFDSIADAALHHKTSPSHVFQCISTLDKVRLFKKDFLIVRGLDEFPDVTYREWQELKSPGGKETMACNLNTGQISIFPSASSLIKILGLSKKAVTTRLNREGIGRVDDYIVAYMSHHEEFKNRVANSSSS